MARSTAHHGTVRDNAGTPPVAVPVFGTALLLIDVINDLAFDGSEALVAQAESMAARLALLKRRATAAGVPTIYINDKFGQWRSDFRRTVAHCTARTSPGQRVSRRASSNRLPRPVDSFGSRRCGSRMMDHASDSVDGLKSRGSTLTPLAVLSAVAVTAGVTAYLAWPGRRSSVSTRQRQALIAYLRDHLSGANMALRIVHRLGSSHQGTEDGTFFGRLSKELEEDRSVVRSLLTRLGASRRSMKRVTGYASGAVLSVIAGGEPGDLSLVRTLEALSIGVQGKRCLWRALQNLRRVPSIFDGMNFVDLEAKAVRQWEAIEERRRALVPRTFSATDPRTE